MTLYTLLKFVHLLAIIVWVGGMFFALFCLRPAAAQILPPPQRLPLLHAALGRFFSHVVLSIAAIILSGAGMIVIVGMKGMPTAWMWMIGLGAVMMTIFFHLRAATYKVLTGAVAASDWPTAGACMERIRLTVLVNLGIGLAIIALMKFAR